MRRACPYTPIFCFPKKKKKPPTLQPGIDRACTKGSPVHVDDSHDARSLSGKSRQYGMLCLPAIVPDVSQDVKNVLDACFSQPISTEWFGCQDGGQLQAKLQCFAPTQYLSDDLLRKLLQITASPNDFLVAESLKLDLYVPDGDGLSLLLQEVQGNGARGVVMPFHVYSSQVRRDQGADRDH